MSGKKKLNRAQRRAQAKRDEAIYQKQQAHLAQEKAKEVAEIKKPVASTKPDAQHNEDNTSKNVKTVQKGAAKKAKKEGVFKRIGQFFSGIKQELKKVNWLSSGELMKSTGVVFGFVLFFTLLTWLEDTGFGALVAKLISA